MSEKERSTRKTAFAVKKSDRKTVSAASELKLKKERFARSATRLKPKNAASKKRRIAKPALSKKPKTVPSVKKKSALLKLKEKRKLKRKKKSAKKSLPKNVSRNA